ncbi:hypothetical protein Tco_1351317 [Tanacetum coccineum]
MFLNTTAYNLHQPSSKVAIHSKVCEERSDLSSGNAQGTRQGNMSYLSDFEEMDGDYVCLWRCDNGTEFKNKEMNQFCKRKGTKACDDAVHKSFLMQDQTSRDNEKKGYEEQEKECGIQVRRMKEMIKEDASVKQYIHVNV